MGCVSSQQKLDQFQKNSYYREDKFNHGKENNANKTISNRYAVSSPEDNEEEEENNNITKKKRHTDNTNCITKTKHPNKTHQNNGTNKKA